jgi:hypothetical protein
MEAVSQKLGANKEGFKTLRRRKFPVVHPLTKSVLGNEEKLTRWTEHVKLPEALTNTMTQRTMPEMFKTPLDAIPESIGEEEDEEEMQAAQDTSSMMEGSDEDRKK